jgi:hypothetical protein
MSVMKLRNESGHLTPRKVLNERKTLFCGQWKFQTGERFSSIEEASK